MKRLTREWVGKAEDDYQAAHQLSDESRRFHDQICFHCQQAAEKYLKRVLQERGVRFDRTHDLEKLLIVLLPAHTRLRGLRRGLKFLRRYAVETRYPGDRATSREADAALRWRSGYARRAASSWEFNRRERTPGVRFRKRQRQRK